MCNQCLFRWNYITANLEDFQRGVSLRLELDSREVADSRADSQALAWTNTSPSSSAVLELVAAFAEVVGRACQRAKQTANKPASFSVEVKQLNRPSAKLSRSSGEFILVRLVR